MCDSCWNHLDQQSLPLCRLCGEALGYDLYATASGAEQLCHLCTLAPPPFRKAVAWGTYQGNMRTLVHLLKYDRLRVLADPLGKRLAGAIALLAVEAPLEMTALSVPLHPHKLRERGFNQAAVLAQSALSHLRHSHMEWKLTFGPELLQRQRATESQAELSPHQRRRNLRGAFFVPRPEEVAGRHILLIDDIYTTGATARACSKTLLAAGARSVWVATLARAQREGVAFWDAPFASSSAASG